MPKLNRHKASRLDKKIKQKKLIEKPLGFSSLDIIKYGIGHEGAAKLIEEAGTLTFVVDQRADKINVKKAFEEIYGEKVKKVNINNTMKGVKKAYIRLVELGNAAVVATKAGIL
ncbi:60S ribosomal protein L23a [Spraguea lophii 42_110]|uniref:60S ribosomal protein L23a n=1 Tax=Spraguea lophii (strain 42_110) TaxID=1358809 RepID=S7XFW8_SPRLO|nr:Chain LX0, 60S ribosomal protein L23a [Spraguea lophii 42_110]7QJH_KX0 Chain KX0, 60S ribosomal protein L23a [Spraguea lophii 42_110]7QJH_LX0 Chain LX0, 60S ribosomal protein L23a [Spraguea lophii 42_110]8BR3_LX0 Chain LX0, 60S ribosomal protein L23a [Spraguea lophii 42_110]8P5D_LX0 Chain LX0, 60S ribosomal protein L23a [Spraguea lophii 42_110]8P60_KX0 Chain KX0, 60S ribosomal protein L23a [Spraguea lophii 42_110]8P60_LX0 Chain LX0, 60S ribosomal protein L23a [Spraguea lophii 42_110]EPR77